MENFCKGWAWHKMKVIRFLWHFVFFYKILHDSLPIRIYNVVHKLALLYLPGGSTTWSTFECSYYLIDFIFMVAEINRLLLLKCLIIFCSIRT